METTKHRQDARLAQLQRQVADLESAIQSLKLRKNVDREARDEYFRLRGVWARKKALLDGASRSRQT
ncbi:MAG: hypothetical protein OEN20_04315 [Gammaproteobacteria bacterium]|nr:hypothetical protein [Gammaproteobacteria bacterium]